MRKKKASTKASPNNYLPANNTTKLTFADTMHCRMARYLIDGWHTMPELMGEDKCGGNAYQYVSKLRRQGVLVVRVRQKGERYGKYKIIHAASSARVLNALDGVHHG